ncbi:hypothetical protein ACHAW6_003188 [Cyclotella cf. meneghiniana]
MSKGLIMTPSYGLLVDCYPDANFTGLYGQEDSQDPHCARSCTRCVILTEIALSTMEAEYLALSQACKDLFPIMDFAQELCSALSLPQTRIANMHIRIFEDNIGTLLFLDQIAQHRIRLVIIATKDQLDDTFTKGLVHSSFAHLRYLLMVW